MTIHYHGTPITPRAVLEHLAGRFFCVCDENPGDLDWCLRNAQGGMLDNGAYPKWRKGAKRPEWSGYYSRCEAVLPFHTWWMVIPDVIDGTEQENDRLVEEWPFGDRGAPVWHLHEPIERLLALCSRWQRVCIGSSGKYAAVGSTHWHGRMIEAMNRLCGNGPAPVWLHMLRGMQCSEWLYPFASVDSTDIARNHEKAAQEKSGKLAQSQVRACGERARKMADRWDSKQCPARWSVRAEQVTMFSEVVYAESNL